MLMHPPMHALGSYKWHPLGLDMFFKSTEMNIEFVERFKQLAKRGAFGHHGEGIDILGKTLATIAELAVRAWDVGVGVVDVA